MHKGYSSYDQHSTTKEWPIPIKTQKAHLFTGMPLGSIHFLEGVVGQRNLNEHECKISLPSLYICFFKKLM